MRYHHIMWKIKYPPIEERFWAKVSKTDGCWLWTSTIATQGYGRFWDGSRRVQAHRWLYEMTVGPIPAGYDLDHTCHNADVSCLGGRSCLHRRCVNPEHLEPVTRAVNAQRGNMGGKKTHCKHGHKYTVANTYITSSGGRRCRQCRRDDMYERQGATRGIKCAPHKRWGKPLD